MGRPGTRPARTGSPTNYMPVYHTETGLTCTTKDVTKVSHHS